MYMVPWTLTPKYVVGVPEEVVVAGIDEQVEVEAPDEGVVQAFPGALGELALIDRQQFKVATNGLKTHAHNWSLLCTVVIG